MYVVYWFLYMDWKAFPHSFHVFNTLEEAQEFILDEALDDAYEEFLGWLDDGKEVEEALEEVGTLESYAECWYLAKAD